MLAFGFLVAACGGGDLALPNGESVLTIRVVDGDGQRGSVGQPLAAPVVVDGVLYIASNEDRVHAFDAATGDLKWISPPVLSA